MKKIALILSFAFIFSLLIAFVKANDAPEEITTVATTTAVSEVVPETAPITTAKPEPKDGITVGMSRDKVIEILKDNYFYYQEHVEPQIIYFIDSNGDNVVVTITPDTITAVERTHSVDPCDCANLVIELGVVESVFRCPPVDKPELSFDELVQTKLTPGEALSKLGMPYYDNVLSYRVCGIKYKTSDGHQVIAEFDIETGVYSFHEDPFHPVKR